MCELSIYRSAEEVRGHGGEDSGVAGTVIYQCLTEFWCHEVWGPGAFEEMYQESEHVISVQGFEYQASPDATGQWQEVAGSEAF